MRKRTRKAIEAYKIACFDLWKVMLDEYPVTSSVLFQDSTGKTRRGRVVDHENYADGIPEVRVIGFHDKKSFYVSIADLIPENSGDSAPGCGDWRKR